MRWPWYPRQGAASSPLRRRGQRGVALLVVVSTITLVGSVVAELQYNTRVDLQLALNARDEVQAEYSALSVMRVRTLLSKNARILDQGLRAIAQTIGMDASMMPQVGQLLEMVPVSCDILSMITKPASSMGGSGGQGAAAEDEGAAGFFPGECTATSKSEHSKISLPALRSARPNDALQAQQLLLGFLSDAKLQRFFEHDDESGDHAESPQELVAAIVDWMDADKNQSGNSVGDEDRYYAYLKDSYRTKNAPFDSIAELQLVHGVSDDLYDILKDRVSIYTTSAQIELSTADDVTIAIGVCSILTQTGYCATLLSTPAFWTALKQLRTLGGTGYSAINPQGLKLVLDTVGVPYDSTKLAQVFADRTSSTWYTIEAEGMLGNARRHIRAVYQTQEGQYYYFRIE
jgi:general secretion pathway protein K